MWLSLRDLCVVSRLRPAFFLRKVVGFLIIRPSQTKGGTLEIMQNRKTGIGKRQTETHLTHAFLITARDPNLGKRLPFPNQSIRWPQLCFSSYQPKAGPWIIEVLVFWGRISLLLRNSDYSIAFGPPTKGACGGILMKTRGLDFIATDKYGSVRKWWGQCEKGRNTNKLLSSDSFLDFLGVENKRPISVWYGRLPK